MSRYYLFLLLLVLPTLALCDIDNYCALGVSGNITLFLQNSTDNSYVSGASCYVDIYDQYFGQITDDGVMLDTSMGFYVYEVTGSEVSTIGKYRVRYNCTSGVYTSYGSGEYQVVEYVPIDSLGYMNLTLQEVNSTTHYINETTYYTNSTISPEWHTWLNETWYNIVTPESNFIVNLFNYLDGRLTMYLNYSDKVDIARMVWNSTIVPRRESSEATTPVWQDWGAGWG